MGSNYSKLTAPAPRRSIRSIFSPRAVADEVFKLVGIDLVRVGDRVG